jgi:hypothetical protein
VVSVRDLGAGQSELRFAGCHSTTVRHRPSRIPLLGGPLRPQAPGFRVPAADLRGTERTDPDVGARTASSTKSRLSHLTQQSYAPLTGIGSLGDFIEKTSGV